MASTRWGRGRPRTGCAGIPSSCGASAGSPGACTSGSAWRRPSRAPTGSSPTARAPSSMTPTDVCLALLVVVIWGVAFIATKIGLASFSPPELAALRFLIASLPALFLARPPVSWPLLGAIGLTLFAGQFLFQFFGIAYGMPPGLASILVQTQALFTILFAALVLRERPTRRQLAGTATAFAGLALIAATVGGDLTALGLGLTAVSAKRFGPLRLCGMALVMLGIAVIVLPVGRWSRVTAIPG